MAELADAIVGTGRATLESAISHVNNHPSWGARVVYGDTDSLFVLLPGRSKESAFTIGNEIATAITAMNPSPIKLKFEKARASARCRPFICLLCVHRTGEQWDVLRWSRPAMHVVMCL